MQSATFNYLSRNLVNHLKKEITESQNIKSSNSSDYKQSFL